MVGQTGVPFGIIDVAQLPISAAELNGQSGSYYRDAANLTGAAQLSGSFTGSFTGSFAGTASNADLLENLDSAYFRNATNLTGAINATQLSGQTSAYYLNYANLTGTPRASGFFTGTLTGTASNADLLDNLDSAYFRDASNLTGTINATQLSGQTSAYYRNGANITGTANLNINGTVGATTPASGGFTALSASSTVTLSNLSASTALVLDGSKNVTGVAPGTSGNVLTSNGTIWTSAAAPASSGKVSLTASGSISAGAPVIINSSGQATVQTNTLDNSFNSKTITTSTTGFTYLPGSSNSSSVKYANNTITGDQASFWLTNTTSGVFFVRQTVDATVLPPVQASPSNGQTTAWSGTYTPRSGEQYGLSEVMFSPTTGYYYYLIARDGTGTPQYQLKIQVFARSNNFSNGVYDDYNVGNGAYTSSPGISNAKNYEMALSSNDKLAIAWSDSSNNLYCCVATLTSSAPYFTWGAMLTINSGGTLNSSQGHMGVAWNSNNNEFVVTYATNASRVTASLISVSGTTCTLQSTSSVASTDYTSSFGRHSVCFVTGVNRYAFSFFTDASATGAATANAAYIVAASSSGTALTYGTPVTFGYSSTVTNDNRKNICFIYNTPVITNSCAIRTFNESSGSDASITIATISGTTPTIAFSTYGEYIGPLSFGAVGYNQNLGTIATVSINDTYSPSTSTLTIANAFRYRFNPNNDFPVNFNFVGFSSASYTNGQTAIIDTIGSTNTSQSSLIPGARYFLQLSGILGLPASTNYAGQALSSTNILIKG